jgi:antitoxin MazE
MKSSIRKIGNSKGVILPQSILKECLIDRVVSIEVKDKHIIISAPEEVKRKGWEQAFKTMAENGDDQLVMPDVFGDEDITDWTW